MKQDLTLDAHLRERFFKAICINDLAEVERFLQAAVVYPDGSTAKFDPNLPHPDSGESPVFLAVRTQSKKMVELLLKYGAKPDVLENTGASAVHAAAVKGDVEMLRILFDAGVSVNQQDKYGYTPLHYASVAGREGVTLLLLERDADMSLKDVNGKTAMDYAAGSGVKGLLEGRLERIAMKEARVCEETGRIHRSNLQKLDALLKRRKK